MHRVDCVGLYEGLKAHLLHTVIEIAEVNQIKDVQTRDKWRPLNSNSVREHRYKYHNTVKSTIDV